MNLTTHEYRVAVPFRAPTAGQSVRRATLIEGPSGWGECSPLAGYPCEPSLARRAAEEAAMGVWPPAVRDSVEVNALVAALPPEVAARRAAAAVAAGFRTVKVKADGGDDDESRERRRFQRHGEPLNHVGAVPRHRGLRDGTNRTLACAGIVLGDPHDQAGDDEP